jgi:starvation-inducible DNA-binding protein
VPTEATLRGASLGGTLSPSPDSTEGSTLAPKTPRSFHTRNDLPKATRAQSIAALNGALADATDLFTQVKHAHWNVKGPDFIALHELFDALAARLLDHVDMIAERVTALGGTAFGTARMAATASRLDEYPTDATDGREHVVALSDRFAQFGATVRSAIDDTAADDASTSDLFTEVSRAVDKDLWFLEAHLTP